jgi:hypothetical protein
MRPTSSRRSELRMGGPVSMDRPGLPQKRAFLWRWSERLLDKSIYLVQILVVSIYRRIFYKLAVKMHMVEEPDESSSIRQDLLSDPRSFKASWDIRKGESSGIFTPTPPTMYRIGTVSDVRNPTPLFIQTCDKNSRSRPDAVLLIASSQCPAIVPRATQSRRVHPEISREKIDRTQAEWLRLLAVSDRTSDGGAHHLQTFARHFLCAPDPSTSHCCTEARVWSRMPQDVVCGCNRRSACRTQRSCELWDAVGIPERFQAPHQPAL